MHTECTGLFLLNKTKAILFSRKVFMDTVQAYRPTVLLYAVDFCMFYAYIQNLTKAGMCGGSRSGSCLLTICYSK